jgi:hypothetical protein
VTSNLSGVMFLAGHRQPSTTAKYMRPQRAAAEDVLQAAAAAGRKEMWQHSGRAKATQKPRFRKPLSAAPQTTENKDEFPPVPVELIGIEPTASRVRWHGGPCEIKDFAKLERQETSGSVSKREIVAADCQNAAGCDAVGEQLERAWQLWNERQDRRELRKALLGLLAVLEDASTSE